MMEGSVWLRPVSHEKSQKKEKKKLFYLDHPLTKSVKSQHRHINHVFGSQDQMITELPSHLHTLKEVLLRGRSARTQK